MQEAAHTRENIRKAFLIDRFIAIGDRMQVCVEGEGSR